MSRLITRRGTRYGPYTLYTSRTRGRAHRRLWVYMMILVLVWLPSLLRSRADEQTPLRSWAAPPRDPTSGAGDVWAEPRANGSLPRDASASMPTRWSPRVAPASMPSPPPPRVASPACAPPLPMATATPTRSRPGRGLAHARRHSARSRRHGEPRALARAVIEGPERTASESISRPMRIESKHARMTPPPM